MLLAGWLWLCLAAPPGPTGGWFNARDFGAVGSNVELRARTVAGSPRVVVQELGDLAVGQTVSVSRCQIRYLAARLWGPAEPYGHCHAVKDEAEFRGYDGAAGSWLVFLIEVDGPGPTFRWSDDLARTWKGTRVPATFGWQPLSGGVEVKLAKRDWQPGEMLTVSARDQLVARITAIEQQTLVLDQPANRSADDAVVQHSDGAAIQAAIDRAVIAKGHVLLPAGYYRLTSPLRVTGATSFCFAGSGPDQTVLDVTANEGPAIALNGGTEATVKDLTVVGHTGHDQSAGAFTTSSGFGFWACALKGCNAVSINATERVLIENVHARRMSSEAFYSQGPCRIGAKEPAAYTKSLTYLRCSAVDCGANAFNNNDLAENTSVLHCRIVDAGPGGWHTWEGPSRFIRFQGNYVRNSGPVTIGDMASRPTHLQELGCGQAIISDNVFEGTARGGGISINYGASQVVVSNNLFINYNGDAILTRSHTPPMCFPSHTVTIRGNLIDLTYRGANALSRRGITVTTDHTVVADNQVFVRGEPDPRVTGVYLGEPALDVDVHDNLLRGCGRGLVTGRATSRVTKVIDATTFLEAGLPLQWQVSHRYRGWRLVWLDGAPPLSESVIEAFDPDTLRFQLRSPHPLKAGDRFEVYPPGAANWTLAHNTIADCPVPVLFDSWGSPTTVLSDNVIDRGLATGAKVALDLRGRCALERNRIVGFDEPGAAALGLVGDRLGRPLPLLVRDNTIERCTRAVSEARPGLWSATLAAGNLATSCGEGWPAH